MGCKMTTKYKHSKEVPTHILAKRLDELSDAVVARMQGNNAKFQREFTCRIPAELDRDADLVLNGAAMRISELVKRIAELEQENKGLSVALSMPTSVDALTTEAFALEQQAKGVKDFEKLFSFYDSEKDCELVYSEDAISYCAKLRKQAAKLKEQK